MFSARKSGAPAGGYSISNSLRFQSASSQYLSRTPASAGNRKTWTWSAWVKLGAAATTGAGTLFSAGTGYTNGSIRTMLVYSGGALYVYNSNFNNLGFNTTAVYRDPSAWYHVVWVMDTTQATASERTAIYINGVRQSGSAVTLTQNLDTWVNYTNAHTIGSVSYTTDGFFDGYMTEINFIDGQALTPSSFGETNTLTGQWIAKRYTGTYGANGFYLPFSNGTSTTTLGADSSGNGNNWTLTNFTRSAGVSDCWMKDVPSGNGGVSGTQPSSNYAVLNPLSLPSSASSSAANLNYSQGGNVTGAMRSTIVVSSGKWYFEGYPTGNAQVLFGFTDPDALPASASWQNANGYFYLGTNGNKYNNNTNSAYGATFTTTDVIGVALDLDNGTLTFYKNNVSQGTAFTGLTGKSLAAAVAQGSASASTGSVNFGQRSFAYTPPSGFKALCTANLPASTIVKGNKYMDATTYTGNGSTQTITNAGGFKPDLVWMKGRSTVSTHVLQDSVRGIYNFLSSETTTAEITNTSTLSSFNSNGFSIGNNTAINTNAATYVGWQWQAGQGTNTTNTNGSITSTVSVNATAGFSIVTYTGTGANATVGHGLGVAPKMIIIKSRSAAATYWQTYHASLGNSYAVFLNDTQGQNLNNSWWNATSPTSTTFSIGTSSYVNVNAQTQVAYCFAEIAGFSKFGIYSGNGSADGPFVYTGFRPKYIMMKNASAGGQWLIKDTTRNPYNVANANLYANLSNAEDTVSTAYIDILSNGFKLRGTYADMNGNTNGIIYMAFAENPFANSNAS